VGGGLGLSKALTGIQLDAAYEYINWYLSGWVGGYLGLAVEGARTRNAVAFARTFDGKASLTIVGRLFTSLAEGGHPPVGEPSWGDTRVILPPSLPAGPYRNALTGTIVELEQGAMSLSRVFAHLPVGILEPA